MKDIFSGVYISFISFIPLKYNFGLVHKLLNCCFNLSSVFLKFHHEVDTSKYVLSKNAKLQKFIYKSIPKLLDNSFLEPQIAIIPIRKTIIILIYSAKMSQVVKLG